MGREGGGSECRTELVGAGECCGDPGDAREEKNEKGNWSAAALAHTSTMIRRVMAKVMYETLELITEKTPVYMYIDKHYLNVSHSVCSVRCVKIYFQSTNSETWQTVSRPMMNAESS